MYFDEIQIGMTVDIAPALIEKEKMLAFAHDYRIYWRIRGKRA